MTFDREADLLFGLTVEFKADRKWHVMSGERELAACPGYEDATQKRLDLVNLYLPKLDQVSIDSFLRGDRIAALRSKITREFDAPARAYTHRADLIAFEVDWNGRVYGGEAYDDEELALLRLHDVLVASSTSLDAVGEEHVGVAAE